MSVVGDRITSRLLAVGLSQAELARRVGVTQPAINHLIKRGSGGSAHLHKIARELETTPEYLSGESDDPQVGRIDGRPPPVARDNGRDDVEIDSIDLAYGMGGTFVDIGEIEVQKAKFSRTWLRKFTHSAPELLFTTSGVGDSMTPTINDHDLVIVDRSEQLATAMGEKIWAVIYGNVGMIKRLRPMPDGTVKLMSDNQSVRDELATDNDLHIVGRVVAVVRRL
jgi:phage repressor protein C with HTH and peptisase S24 domain